MRERERKENVSVQLVDKGRDETKATNIGGRISPSWMKRVGITRQRGLRGGQ